MHWLFACTAPAPSPATGVADTDAEDTDLEDTGLDTDLPVASPCARTSSSVQCPYDSTNIDGIAGVQREVHHAVPDGTPPAAGWPVAILFQGSFFSAELFFEGNEGDLLGGLYQAQLTDELLAAGFAVLAPEAHLDGGLYWDTNIPPWNVSWTSSPDHAMLTSLFAGIEDGTFGPLDGSLLYATGISSGGYMTSRMAVSYPGRFTKLAIQSGSYATCGGSLCIVTSVPDDHPPTLFVHGRADVVVPWFTTVAYRNQLHAQGTPFEVLLDDGAGHTWFDGGPTAIVDFFSR